MENRQKDEQAKVDAALQSRRVELDAKVKLDMIGSQRANELEDVKLQKVVQVRKALLVDYQKVICGLVQPAPEHFWRTTRAVEPGLSSHGLVMI